MGNKRVLTIVEARWLKYLGGRRHGKEVWSRVLVLSAAMMAGPEAGSEDECGTIE